MREGVLEPAIQVFVEMLRREWDSMAELSALAGLDFPDLASDWSQANWEAIVEAAVSEGDVFLDVYGDGADCNATGSRVSMPEAASTHAVRIRSKSGEAMIDRLSGRIVQAPDVGFAFDRFASIGEGGWYVERPPFDYVLARTESGEEVLFALADSSFVIGLPIG